MPLEFDIEKLLQAYRGTDDQNRIITEDRQYNKHHHCYLVVIIHRGAQPYLQKVLSMAALHHDVILFGDESNRHFSTDPHVYHLSIGDYFTEAANFRTIFRNFSTNGYEYEFLCFARVFIMYEFLTRHHISACFHLDSDCLLLTDINRLSWTPNISYYNICQSWNNPHRMCACISNALLTHVWCQRFVDLCKDIYSGKALELIRPKIDHHQKYQLPGGVCDMTLQYLIAQQYPDEVANLLVINDGVVFDHHIRGSESAVAQDYYEMIMMGSHRVKKTTIEVDGSVYFHVAATGERIRTYSLHFQGSSKEFIDRYYSALLPLLKASSH